MSWTRAFIVVGLFLLVWQMLMRAPERAAGMTEAELAQLAASIKDTDIVMYSTTDCPYCAQARSWLEDHRFPYSECDAQRHEKCAADMAAFGATGVPYMIVRDEHLGEGFDSEALVAALQRSGS